MGRERNWRAFDWISFPSPSYGLSMAHSHNPDPIPCCTTKSLVKVIPGTRLFSKSNWLVLRTFHGSSSINSIASVRLSELLVEIVLRGPYKAPSPLRPPWFCDADARRCRLWLDLTFFGCWNIVSCSVISITGILALEIIQYPIPTRKDVYLILYIISCWAIKAELEMHDEFRYQNL